MTTPSERLPADWRHLPRAERGRLWQLRQDRAALPEAPNEAPRLTTCPASASGTPQDVGNGSVPTSRRCFGAAPVGPAWQGY
jgi:hypothetical protein